MIRMWFSAWFMGILVAALVLVSAEVRSEPAATTAECLGGFCFGGKLIEERELVKRHGPGYTEGGKFPFHCYWVPEQKLFVQFRVHHGLPKEVNSVFVSKVPSCPKAYTPTNPFKALLTHEGVRIGDPYQKVIDVYGIPDFRERGTGLNKIGIPYEEARATAPFGEEALIYRKTPDELLGSVFYVHEGQVSAIEISVSE